MSFQGTTRADPYGRSLAHTALISDEWRRSDMRDKDEAHEVGGAIVRRVQVGEPSWACSFGYDAGVLAPKGETPGPGRPRGYRDFPVLRSS